MELITYNLPENSERRKSAKEITFDEEKETIRQINNILNGAFEIPNLILIQKFIDNYQNLNYHRTITCGLYATDAPKLTNELKNSEYKNLFWTIEF